MSLSAILETNTLNLTNIFLGSICKNGVRKKEKITLYS